MTFPLYREVVLARDVPESRLRRGDLVRLVEHHVSPEGQEGYSAEILGANGRTVAVVAVPVDALAPLRDDEVLSRSMTA